MILLACLVRKPSRRNFHHVEVESTFGIRCGGRVTGDGPTLLGNNTQKEQVNNVTRRCHSLVVYQVPTRGWQEERTWVIVEKRLAESTTQREGSTTRRPTLRSGALLGTRYLGAMDPSESRAESRTVALRSDRY